jgi:hypothetical protein
VAETEIEADHDVAHAEAAGQHVVHELLGRLAQQVFVEGEREQVRDAELGQQARLDPKRREARRRAVGRQDLARMGLEGDHAKRRLKLLRTRTRRLDQGAMPAVHAVEIADRDHLVQGGLRQAPIAAVNLHGGLMPAGCCGCKGLQSRSALATGRTRKNSSHTTATGLSAGCQQRRRATQCPEGRTGVPPRHRNCRLAAPQFGANP